MVMVDYKIKELVTMIGCDDCPIQFEKISERTSQIFYFKPISNTEYHDVIIMGRDEAPFNYYKIYEKEIGVYMPDATVSEVIDFDKKRCEIRTELYWKFISGKIDVEGYDREIVYCVFSILHEIGHWYNYLQQGLTPTEYVRAEKIEKDRDNQLHDGIIKEKNSVKRKQLIEEEFIFYRSMKNEREADGFAFEYIEESLKEIYERQAKFL